MRGLKFTNKIFSSNSKLNFITNESKKGRNNSKSQPRLFYTSYNSTIDWDVSTDPHPLPYNIVNNILDNDTEVIRPNPHLATSSQVILVILL